MPGEAENIISMERFHGMLKSVECADDSMTISFVDDGSYRYAQRAWDWVNGADNHSFVMVASKGDCGNNAYRVPYVVHTISYEDHAMTAHLNAQIAQWSDVAHSYRLRAGSISNEDSPNRRDISKETSISLNSDFRFKSKAAVGPVSIELKCEPCEITGSLEFEFTVVVDNLIPKDVKLKAAPKAVRAEADIDVVFGFAEAKAASPRVPLGNFPLPGGITIPGNILNLGPTLNVEYGAELSGQLAISFGTGAIATIPDSALLEVNLLNPTKNKVTSWKPKVDMNPAKFDANQFKASVKLNQFIELSIKLGAEVLNKGIAAGLALKMPYVETEAEFIAQDLPGLCDNNPKSDVGIKITNAFGVELNFVAGNKEVSLAAGSFPLGEPLCWGWDAPGNPRPSPSTRAIATHRPSSARATVTPRPSPGPEANSCKVGRSYASGTCRNKNKCMDSGMVPVPGWCPDDPVDVQCCVERQGGDYCTVESKTGTCMSVTVCDSSDGISTPGYCPNDPKGIQVS
jgi:hypothetical protein